MESAVQQIAQRAPILNKIVKRAPILNKFKDNDNDNGLSLGLIIGIVIMVFVAGIAVRLIMINYAPPPPPPPPPPTTTTVAPPTISTSMTPSPPPSSGSPASSGSPTITPTEGSESSPCEGSWSSCSFSEANGCTKNYTISRAKYGSGADCEASDNDISPCSPGEGSCPIDCVGGFEDCQESCKKTYRITTPSNNGGVSCPHPDNYQEDCQGGEGACPMDRNCDGSWSPCDSSCGTSTYTVRTPQSGNGSPCPTSSTIDCSPGDGECATCVTPVPYPEGYIRNGYNYSSDRITLHRGASSNDMPFCSPDYEQLRDLTVGCNEGDDDNWEYTLSGCTQRNCERYGYPDELLLSLNNIREKKLFLKDRTSISPGTEIIDIDRNNIYQRETFQSPDGYILDKRCIPYDTPDSVEGSQDDREQMRGSLRENTECQLKIQTRNNRDNSITEDIWRDYMSPSMPPPSVSNYINKGRLSDSVEERQMYNNYREIYNGEYGFSEMSDGEDNPYIINRPLKIPFEADDNDIRNLCMAACNSHPITPIEWVSTTGLDQMYSGTYTPTEEQPYEVEDNINGFFQKYYDYRNENYISADFNLMGNPINQLPDSGGGDDDNNINTYFDSLSKCYGVQVDPSKAKVLNYTIRDGTTISKDACKLIVSNEGGDELVKGQDYIFTPSPSDANYKVYEKCEVVQHENLPPKSILRKYFGDNAVENADFNNCSGIANRQAGGCSVINKINDENNTEYCLNDCINSDENQYQISGVPSSSDGVIEYTYNGQTCKLFQDIGYQGFNIDSSINKSVDYDIFGQPYSKIKLNTPEEIIQNITDGSEFDISSINYKIGQQDIYTIIVNDNLGADNLPNVRVQTRTRDHTTGHYLYNLNTGYGGNFFSFKLYDNRLANGDSPSRNIQLFKFPDITVASVGCKTDGVRAPGNSNPSMRDWLAAGPIAGNDHTNQPCPSTIPVGSWVISNKNMSRFPANAAGYSQTYAGAVGIVWGTIAVDGGGVDYSVIFSGESVPNPDGTGQHSLEELVQLPINGMFMTWEQEDILCTSLVGRLSYITTSGDSRSNLVLDSLKDDAVQNLGSGFWKDCIIRGFKLPDEIKTAILSTASLYKIERNSAFLSNANAGGGTRGGGTRGETCPMNTLSLQNKLGGEVFGIDKCSNRKYIKYCEKDLDGPIQSIQNECLSRYTGDVNDITTQRPCMYYDGKCFDAELYDPKTKCVDKIDEVFYSLKPDIWNIMPQNYINSMDSLFGDGATGTDYNQYSNIRDSDKVLFRNTLIQNKLNTYFVGGAPEPAFSENEIPEDIRNGRRAWDLSPEFTPFDNYKYGGASCAGQVGSKYYTPKCYIPTDATTDVQSNVCGRQWTYAVDPYGNEISVPCNYDLTSQTCTPSDYRDQCIREADQFASSIESISSSVFSDNYKWDRWRSNNNHTTMFPDNNNRPNIGDSYNYPPNGDEYENQCQDKEYVRNCNNIVNIGGVGCDGKWTINNDGDATLCWAPKNGPVAPVLLVPSVYCSGGGDNENRRESESNKCIKPNAEYIVGESMESCNQVCDRQSEGGVCVDYGIEDVTFLDNFPSVCTTDTARSLSDPNYPPHYYIGEGPDGRPPECRVWAVDSNPALDNRQDYCDWVPEPANDDIRRLCKCAAEI